MPSAVVFEYCSTHVYSPLLRLLQVHMLKKKKEKENLYDKSQKADSAPPSDQACDRLLRHFHNKVCGWGKEKKKSDLAEGRKKKQKGEGRYCHETAELLSLPLYFLPCSVLLSSSHPSLNSLFYPLSSCHPQMNSMNSVSSSEDIKPPPGLQSLGNINYQCTSPGGMSKHICAICGDRSSGNI